MSLVFAFIAAMVIVLAGLLSDVSLLTVLLRSLVGFLITGVIVWLAAVILEHQNIVGFDKNLELIDPDGPADPKSPEEYDKEDAASGQMAADEAVNSETEETSVAAGDFMPLSQDNLKHMEPPADS